MIISGSGVFFVGKKVFDSEFSILMDIRQFRFYISYCASFNLYFSRNLSTLPKVTSYWYKAIQNILLSF